LNPSDRGGGCEPKHTHHDDVHGEEAISRPGLVEVEDGGLVGGELDDEGEDVEGEEEEDVEGELFFAAQLGRGDRPALGDEEEEDDEEDLAEDLEPWAGGVRGGVVGWRVRGGGGGTASGDFKVGDADAVGGELDEMGDEDDV
jgi:hypothetical protein